MEIPTQRDPSTDGRPSYSSTEPTLIARDRTIVAALLARARIMATESQSHDWIEMPFRPTGLNDEHAVRAAITARASDYGLIIDKIADQRITFKRI